MIQIAIGLIVIAVVTGSLKEFVTRLKIKSYTKKRLLKTEKLVFDSSADLLKFVDGIYKHAKKLKKETPEPDEEKLTSHQYDVEYQKYTRELFEKMFQQYPQLITISEDGPYGRNSNYGDKPYESFEPDMFEVPHFFEQTILIDFDAKVEDVYVQVSYYSGRRNTVYTSDAPKGRTLESIKKGENINLKGYIHSVIILGLKNKYETTSFEIGVIFDE